ncbi:MAG: peptide deformylase [Firmicutes bacterium]|nr:peptide deformylase [Bacillota bacterium]
MALRRILTDGDETLKKVCRPVTEINDRIRSILDDMAETMHDAGGVGLAAPQVGILRRMFVVQTDPEGPLYELINPQIMETDGEQTGDEGCLSVPGYVGTVTRPNYVKIKGLDRNGNSVEYEGTELLARAFLHENDHLDGVLYTQKATDIHYAETEEEE